MHSPQRSAAARWGVWPLLLLLLLLLGDGAAATEPPVGKLAETVELGRLLVEQTATHPLTRDYVGAALNCTSCHLGNTEVQCTWRLGLA